MEQVAREREGGERGRGERETERERGVKSRSLHLHQFYKANQLIVLITNIFRTITIVDIFTKST